MATSTGICRIVAKKGGNNIDKDNILIWHISVKYDQDESIYQNYQNYQNYQDYHDY